MLVPLSVLIPIKNEEKNLTACLDPIYNWADEILIIDSKSTDASIDIANQFGAKVIQFEYNGGWPKKRQWALDNYLFKNEWILLLDADEILLPKIKVEIEQAIQNNSFDGYTVLLQMEFLGKHLKYAYPGLRKLSLFKIGKGRFEKRLQDQDSSMADIEIHEHVIVDGKIGHLKNPILHRNYNSLSRYINKHNEYSNWEASIFLFGDNTDLQPSLLGSQAQKRRFLKKLFMRVPGISFIYFFYQFFLKLGFLDGYSGYYFCLFKMIYFIEIKAKIYELEKGLNRNSAQIKK